MDVAVKVIQHDASALEAVENEVQLQMYLNHPNIVSSTAPCGGAAAHAIMRWLRQ
jgi:hypothetical protein